MLAPDLPIPLSRVESLIEAFLPTPRPDEDEERACPRTEESAPEKEAAFTFPVWAQTFNARAQRAGFTFGVEGQGADDLAEVGVEVEVVEGEVVGGGEDEGEVVGGVGVLAELLLVEARQPATSLLVDLEGVQFFVVNCIG